MKKIENSFVVTGFIGKDAEIRSFSTASVARFSVALSRPEKSEENPHYISAFINVEAWRKNESKESFEVLKKGSLVTMRALKKSFHRITSATVKLEVQHLHRPPPSLERSGKGGGGRWKSGIGSSGNTR